MKEVAGASLSFVLDDLDPATLYEVYVVASTSKGDGESSQHVEEFTEPPAGIGRNMYEFGSYVKRTPPPPKKKKKKKGGGKNK